MKIGLISDTHGDFHSMQQALELLRDTDCILHAGDLYQDSRWLSTQTHQQIEAVIGNGDPVTAGPDHQLLKLDHLNILLCHGHIQRVQHSLTSLYYFGLEKTADVVIFGHTHVPLVLQQGLVIINPGSTSRPRSEHGCTCGILETGTDSAVTLLSLTTGQPVVYQPLQFQ
ncbi:metallophosphoesterase family protein [Anoxynatronum buryatiense]|uniref:Phosphoesterase n=1 Tax=Anoxynatronum buryatiense TaxID=489973 RepID=A0AA45WX58_9CLOT|nr:metallophosphoesterase [Anoxynatronum buryatiense]SMP62583.1 hypothetical protein SAMN06296020_11033 [Anoxynatronum buryatiense]